MQELLNLILKNITTHPEEVVIEESEEAGMAVFTISVNPEDMGRVIGKDGKVIRAIRSLAHVIAVRQGKRFRIKLADAQGMDTDESTPEIVKPEKEVKSKSTPKDETAELIAGAIDMPDAPASDDTGSDSDDVSKADSE